MWTRSVTILVILALLSCQAVDCGPILGAVAVCDFAAKMAACYAAAGFTFGTVIASAATPAVILACIEASGPCMIHAAAATLAPTPRAQI
jgi:alpha/beta superfamily hydrolase